MPNSRIPDTSGYVTKKKKLTVIAVVVPAVHVLSGGHGGQAREDSEADPRGRQRPHDKNHTPARGIMINDAARGPSSAAQAAQSSDSESDYTSPPQRIFANCPSASSARPRVRCQVCGRATVVNQRVRFPGTCARTLLSPALLNKFTDYTVRL